MTKEQAMIVALIRADLHNEDGEQIVDFKRRMLDSKDFCGCGVSRDTLRDLISAAYDLGLEAGKAKPKQVGKWGRPPPDPFGRRA